MGEEPKYLTPIPRHALRRGGRPPPQIVHKYPRPLPVCHHTLPNENHLIQRYRQYTLPSKRESSGAAQAADEINGRSIDALGEEGRHHVHESIIQKAVNGAARKAGLTQRATHQTIRHSFTTQILESGYATRAVQDLLGHKDVKTTMI